MSNGEKTWFIHQKWQKLATLVNSDEEIHYSLQTNCVQNFQDNEAELLKEKIFN